MHAEPTTFGVKLAGFAFEAHRNLIRLERAAEAVSVGALSGAVGTYAANGPEVEEAVLRRLGLAREDVSTQVVPRDRHAELLEAIALAGAGLERFATEVRHLQRTEVREVEEPFRSGEQKGSSAMPHKRNPIVSERIAGIARLLRGYAQAGLENVALWHERDITHSSVERVTLPDATILLDYAQHLAIRVVEGMTVHEDRMRENLNATHGALYSQRALLALVEAGRSRDDAYRTVQEAAQRAWDEGVEFRDLLAEAAPELDLDAVFDTGRIRAPRPHDRGAPGPHCVAVLASNRASSIYGPAPSAPMGTGWTQPPTPRRGAVGAVARRSCAARRRASGVGIRGCCAKKKRKPRRTPSRLVPVQPLPPPPAPPAAGSGSRARSRPTPASSACARRSGCSGGPGSARRPVTPRRSRAWACTRRLPP